MAHPHQSKREHTVSRSRAKELTKGYASGGAVPAAATSASVSTKRVARMTGGKIAGFAPKPRMDRPGRASGGRIKRAPQTNIHINVTPPPSVAPLAASAVPGGLPAPRPAPPPMPAPPPGMGGPGAPGAMPLPTGLPPGGPLAMRAKGGRVGTPVQHLPNTEKFPKRGKPVTYADGGKVKVKPPLTPDSPQFNPDSPTGRFTSRSPSPKATGGGIKNDQVEDRGPKRADPAPRIDRRRSEGMGEATGVSIGGTHNWGYKGRRSGGPINSPAKGGMGPKMPGGGRGGLGRLAKAKRAKN